MDKKELIKEFLNSFKKNLNISSFYSKDHPLFIKAVEDFKKSVDSTLDSINPIPLSIAIDHILFEGIKFSDPSCAELAKRLHLHRIKGIQIKKDITFEELIFLLDMASAPLKKLIKDGSISAILNKQNMTHLIIEEIDYYELLKAETGEFKDIWVYLLTEATNNKDHVGIIQLSDTFGKMLRHLTVKEILENSDVYEMIQRFIIYLKDKDKERFSQCAKELARRMLNIKNVFSQPDLEKLKILFNSFAENDFADILIEELLSTDEFAAFSFDLFFEIVDVKMHPPIASLTVEFLNKKFLGDKQKISHKIEKLLAACDKFPASSIYRNTFSPFLESISYGKVFSFDRDLVYVNYRLILINLFLEEKNKDQMGIIIGEISKELKNIIQNKDLVYLKLLVDVLKKKKTEDAQTALLFEGLDRQITDFVENNIWEEELSEDLQYLADYPDSSVLDPDLYLSKMFDDREINATALKLFLKFFPDSLNLLYANLEKKYWDIELIEKVLKGLKLMGNILALNILGRIYLLPSNYIKKEVLATMQQMDILDKEFLFSILQKDDVFLKKEALLILMKDNKAEKEALEILFSVKSPWGRNNRIIMDNIIAVEEAELTGAKDYLIAISKKHFFWNWNIKRKAKEVLKRWKL